MERDTHRCSHSGGERAAALSHDMHRLGDSRQVERSRDMSEKHRCPIAGDEASRRGEDGEPRRRHDAPCFSESPKQGHVWFPEAISGHDMCRESRRRMPLHCAGVRVGLLSLGIAAIAVLAMPVAGGARRHQGTLSSMIAASAASGPRPLGGQQLGDLAKSADAMDTGAAVVEVGDKKGGVAVHDRKLLEVEPAPRKQTTQGQAAQGISGGGSTMGRISLNGSDGRYSRLAPVADGSYRTLRAQPGFPGAAGGRAGTLGNLTSRIRGVAGNLTAEAGRRFASARGFDDVWATTDHNNASSPGIGHAKSTSSAIERIRMVLGNGTGPTPPDPTDFTLPTPTLDPITMVALSIAGVTMIGSFLSALVGFAFALTTTSLLSNLVGSKTAQPLVAILFFVNQCILLHKKGLGDWHETGVLILASLATVPVGIFALVWLDAAIGEQVLGLLIVCYVLYSVADLRLPELNSRWHTVATGLFAGLTVGAFNIGGPWIAMYGQCRRWRADKFASNLITYQAPTCVFALAVHVFRGSFMNRELWYYASCAIPGMFIGSQLGEIVSKRINEATFKVLTMMLIAVMGTRLLLNGLPPHHVATVICFFFTAAGAIVYQKMQRPKDKNLVLPVGPGHQEDEAQMPHRQSIEMSYRGKDSPADKGLGEAGGYRGGDVEYAEDDHGGDKGGMHHRAGRE